MDKYAKLMASFLEKKYPTFEEIKDIVAKCIEKLKNESRVLNLKAPKIIVGDLHGHFEDLITIFNVYGHPPISSYLFLGNYVDKGHYSLFVMLYLLCCKIEYPDQIFLLRGAHESLSINELYGFSQECRVQYKSDKVWKEIIKVYKHLSLAATFEKQKVGLSALLHSRWIVTGNQNNKADRRVNCWTRHRPQ
jgi:hypothetical protein